MATHHLAQGHPQAWPWGVAMYTNLHYHHHQQQQYYEREHLFEKPLTPSDVGKLNRLVIPKQHAERHFPLGGGAGAGAEGNEKGLLLEFDDEAGRPWRFRYSYWVSSQSYVLTKGWSRYVKEKRLDAGDVVRFDRVRGAAAGAPDRLFICCRRRGESAASAAATPTPSPPVAPALNAGEQQQQPWSPTVCYSTSGSSYPPSPASPYAYHVDTPHAGAGEADAKSSGGTPTTGTAPTRKLRLFGVNLDCGPEPEPGTPTAAMYGYGYVHQSPYAAVPAVPSYWGSS